MRWLIVHANPDPHSFTGAIRDQVIASLTSEGHDVRVIDLYALGFDPNFPPSEHAAYLDVARDHPDSQVRAHIELLRWAEGIVFVFPTWWASLPAILKGWLDRVFLPHVAFTLHPETGRVSPALTNVRRLVGVTTSGAPTWKVRLAGDGARTTIGRTVRLVCNRRTRLTWLSLGTVHRASAADRRRFLAQVDRRLRDLS